MLRTKINPDGSFNENSYNATDEVNQIKWDTLEDEVYADVVDYYKGLIAFRKAHPVLRLTTAEDVANHVAVVDMAEPNVTAFHLTGGLEGETADAMYIVFNPNKEAKEIELPEGEWNICINGEDAGTESLGKASDKVTVEAVSALVLVQGENAVSAGADEGLANGSSANGVGGIGAAAAVLGVAAVGAGAYLFKKKKEK